MSVALNISYSLLSAAELWDGILKTTEYLRMMDVFVSVELRMLRRADYLPTVIAFRGCEHVSLWGACNLSHILLSLAFATRWNEKHPSCVCLPLFLKLYCIPIYSLDSSFRQLSPLSSLFPWTKAKKLKAKKIFFVLSLKLKGRIFRGIEI